MADSTLNRRPPLTVAAALRRIAEDAVRRDPSLMAKKSPAPDDEERGDDDTPTP